MADEVASFNAAKQYYTGTGSKRPNYRMAKKAFEETLEANPEHVQSIYYLGLMATKAQGGPKDLDQAKEYFAKAASLNHESSTNELFKLFAQDTDSADEWFDLGENYYKEDNCRVALGCYLKAVAKDPKHADSLYSLGYLYKNEIVKDLTQAKKYLMLALESGHEFADQELFNLYEDEAESAEDWYQIGEIFFGNKKLSNRYELAFRCYKRATDLDSEHADSLYDIAWLYQQGGYGLQKNLEKARSYYRRALAEGDKHAVGRLIEIYQQQLTTSEQWYELGEEFYWGKNNSVKSFEAAMACYLLVIKKDQRNVKAHYSIGWLYDHNEGVEYDFEKAQSSYATAANLGYLPAKKSLLLLNNQELTTAKEWYLLGDKYFIGRVGYKQDLFLARICYERSLELDEAYQDSLLKLGTIYEEGKGVTVDFDKAREFFAQLDSDDKKLHLKRVEKKYVQVLLAEGGNINERDKNNSTTMHRAAQGKNLKLYATLKVLGAEEDILDKKKKSSGHYLTEAEKISVIRLQKLVNSNLQDMELSTPKLVASQIIIQGAPYDKDTTDQVVEELYKKPDLKPLFDLAKLAMLGKHKLSGRKVVIEDGYDSDQEVAATPDECLDINIDSKKNNINGLVCRDNPKTSTVGIFIPDLPNSIFIGGDRDKQKVRGTLVHELMHFIAREVFGNSKPYDDKDAINMARFTQICDALKKNFEDKRRRNSKASPNLFEITFDGGYGQAKYHSELIARIAQAIALSSEDLMAQGQPERDLLKYYREVFLVKVKEHTEILTKKAYGGWSPTLFKQNRDEPYHLDTSNVMEDSVDDSQIRP